MDSPSLAVTVLVGGDGVALFCVSVDVVFVASVVGVGPAVSVDEMGVVAAEETLDDVGVELLIALPTGAVTAALSLEELELPAVLMLPVATAPSKPASIAMIMMETIDTHVTDRFQNGR